MHFPSQGSDEVDSIPNFFVALKIYSWPSQWPWHVEKGVFQVETN